MTWPIHLLIDGLRTQYMHGSGSQTNCLVGTLTTTITAPVTLIVSLLTEVSRTSLWGVVDDQAIQPRRLLLLQRYISGLSTERAWVQIPFAAVSTSGHFRSLHDAPVHSAV